MKSKPTNTEATSTSLERAATNPPAPALPKSGTAVAQTELRPDRTPYPPDDRDEEFRKLIPLATDEDFAAISKNRATRREISCKGKNYLLS